MIGIAEVAYVLALLAASAIWIGIINLLVADYRRERALRGRKTTDDWRRARGCVVPPPGSPPSEVIIRRVRDGETTDHAERLNKARSSLLSARGKVIDIYRGRLALGDWEDIWGYFGVAEKLLDEVLSEMGEDAP